MNMEDIDNCEYAMISKRSFKNFIMKKEIRRSTVKYVITKFLAKSFNGITRLIIHYSTSPISLR